jgi:hypothetical protein
MGTQKATLTLTVGGPFSASGFFRVKSTGEVEDIQSWLFKGGTKDDIDDADEFKSFTITPFQNADDNNNWWVQIDMTAADVLAHFTAGILNGVWDFWYSDDGGNNYFKFARGSFVVEKKATDLS